MKTPLELLRSYLIENKLSAFIIPSNDPFFGEYIPDHYACRAWLSGFSGSAGTLVVTPSEAALWTDSRYFVRAEQEMTGRGITLMKLKVPGTPTLEEWLLARCPVDGLIGIDGMLFALPEYERLKKAIHPLLFSIEEDPFNILWKDRPALPNAPSFLLDERFTGASVSQKHRSVVEALSPDIDFIYPVMALDEIAWLLNMRGQDVAYNPVTVAFAAVTPRTIFLFMECKEVEHGKYKPIQLSEKACDTLQAQGVEFKPIHEFRRFLSSYPKEATRIIHQDRWPILLQLNVIESQELSFTPDPYRGGCISHLKAIKNKTEIEGFKLALKKDAVAWVRFWRYIEENLPLGFLTEQLLASKIAEFRAIDPDYRGESFFPILGYAKNGALPHYAMDPNGETPIKPHGFLLVDSGGHYFYGTTDTTRTFALGPLDEAQKRDFTAALKGTIGLSMAIFPSGTRGALLDILAREPVWAAGRSYLHGTGHGVGHYLNVHEGPMSIRMEENPVAIEPGMVLSNEPAIYVLGSYGIRIENMMLCVPYLENEQGTFYAFETLTRCPIDTAGIEVSLLGEEARQWLNNYHAKVYEDLAPLLTPQEAEWLKVKTQAI